MAEVRVNSGKAYLKLLKPDSSGYYNEELGALAEIEGEVPDIKDGGTGAIVRGDLNNALNAFAALTESSMVSKLVDYTMEVSNE